MLCNGDTEKYWIGLLIVTRYYSSCISTVLAVFRVCIHVVLLLWMVEVLRSFQEYLRAALAVIYAWEDFV
jgi:hypothetical protein